MQDCVSCHGRMPPNARFCPSCGAPTTPAVVAEERKLVTVVFCDLVGSTPLSETLDPETLRSVILQYFAAMREQIEQFGGTVEKFIGDAVMAVFGVPVIHEDDARRAATAALGMLDALAELNARLDTALGVRLQVRIGVHTGPAVTSTDASSRQALVSGETVNVAARLEQAAGAGEILIGPVTRDALGPAARTEAVGPLRLKGKAAPVTAHRLLGLGAENPELSRRFDLPFVGRTRELDELDRLVDAAAALRRSQLVVVCGEPGIGKTRLVHEWLDRVERPLASGAGRCRPYGEQGSLAPLAEAVNNILAGPGGRVPHDPAALAILTTGLLRDGTPGPSLDGACTALARFLAAVSRTHPVVLVLDDCQWASDPLLDAVERVTRLTARVAVVFVCLARLDLFDRRPAFGAAPAQRVILAGLSVAECRALVGGLAEVTAHRSAATAPALEAAGGNPFYLEQLIAAAETSPAGELPHTLQSLLGARLDALGQAERAALDLAAVLGREFLPRHVTTLAHTGPEGGPGGPLAAGADGDPVPAALTRLGRRRLVEPSSVPATGTSMRFSNGLIHEATYGAMSKRTRAERHERAAEVIAGEESSAGRAAPAVAGHLERAYRYRAELGVLDGPTDSLRLRAAALLSVAGSQALVRSDLSWAGTLLGRAVDLLEPGEPGWAAATRKLGEVRMATGHGSEGRALLGAVLDAGSDPVEAAHARLALAAADGAAAVGATATVARESLSVFRAAGDQLGLTRARIRIAQEQQLHGRHVRATGLLATALACAVRHGAEPERALALGAIGVSLWRGPTPVPTALVECRALLAEHGGPRPVVRITLNCPLAVLLALDEQWDAARQLLAEADQLADELGYVESAVVIPVFGAAVESLAGHLEPALRLLDRAGDAARTLAPGTSSGVAREAARLLVCAGRHAEAADRLNDDVDAAGLLRSDLADLDGVRARLAAARGAGAEAVRLAERAVSAAAETDSPIVRGVAALDRAVVLHQIGQPGPAAAAAAAARRYFAAKGHLPGVARASELATGPDTGRPSTGQEGTNG